MSNRKKDLVDITIKEMDVCLLYIDGFPNSFVRINWIWETDRRGWWNVNSTKLGLPCDNLQWILDSSHLAGESWMMDGMEMHFQLLRRPDLAASESKAKPAPEVALAEPETVPRRPLKQVPASAAKCISIIPRLHKD